MLLVLLALSFGLHGFVLWRMFHKHKEPNVEHSTPVAPEPVAPEPVFSGPITILKHVDGEWVPYATRDSKDHPDYREAVREPGLAIRHSDGTVELGNQALKNPCQ